MRIFSDIPKKWCEAVLESFLKHYVESGVLGAMPKADFMFQLFRDEWTDLKCQIGIASSELIGGKGKATMKLAISKTAVLDWKRKFTHIYRINTSHASVSAPGKFLNIQRGTF